MVPEGVVVTHWKSLEEPRSSKALSSLKMSESEKREEKLLKSSNPKPGVSEGRLPKVRGLWTSASENNEKGDTE